MHQKQHNLGEEVWVNVIAPSLRPNSGNHGLILGKSSPFMAELFRLVNCSNLARQCININFISKCHGWDAEIEYPLVMTNIAIENHRFGKTHYLYGHVQQLYKAFTQIIHGLSIYIYIYTILIYNIYIYYTHYIHHILLIY